MLKLIRLLVIPLLIMVGGYLLWAGYDEVRDRTLDQFRAQRFTLARQTAKGLRTYFRYYERLAEHLAENPSIVNFGPEGRMVMHGFFDAHHGNLHAVTLLDAQGRILYTVPANAKIIGRDVSQQEHNVRLFKTRRPVVSDVFRALQGYRTIAVSVPVMQDGEFKGALALLLPFETITTYHLDESNISPHGRVLLISRKGTVLYSWDGSEPGGKAWTWAAGCPELENMVHRMTSGARGVASFRCPVSDTSPRLGQVYQAVYLPIDLGTTFWSLALASPEADILAAMQGFRDRWLLAAGVLFMCALVYGLLAVRSWVAERESRRRRRAEDALSESEERYRILVEFAPVPIIVHQDGRFVYLNPASLEMHAAKSTEDLLGRSIFDFVHPDYRDQVSERMQGERDKGVRRDLEMQIVTLDGRVRDLDTAAMTVNFEGRPATLVITRDVTEEKKAAKALRLAEEKYRGIFENAVEGIYQTTPEGAYLSANPSLARIYGYSSPEELMTAVRDVGSQVFVEPGRRQDLLLKVLEKGSVTDFHARIRKKDGSQALVSINARAVYDPGGELRYLEGTVEDITERQKAAEALRLSEEKFAKAFRHSPVWVVLATLEEGRFMEVNDSFLKDLGFTREEVIGHTSRELNLWADYGQRQEIQRCLEKDGRAPDFEVEMRAKDGRLLQTVMWAETIEMEGRRCLLGVSMNVTERAAAMEEKKRLEAQLAQARKMEAVGTLAGGIAHDFNNILQAISGYVQLMLMQESPQKDYREELGEIDRMVDRATDLIRRLLTFSRKVEPVFKEVNLNHRVEQAVRMLERTIPKMIGIDTDLEPELWSLVGDPTQLDQVLMNLGSNARDAMPDGGRLLISTANLEVEDTDQARSVGLKPGLYVELTVQDSGVGMDQAIQESIFDPFFTTKGVGQGTGLGLSTVYGVVKAHAGQITCQSSPGQGTAFRVYLPALAREQAGEREDALASHRLPTGEETLLLVDDEEAILAANRQIFETLGYRVVTASSGEEALDRYFGAGPRPDLVILDLGMPGMGGRRALEAILEGDPGARVLIASGYAADGTVRESLEKGAVGFIAKPYLVSELAVKVRRALDAR